MIKEVPESRRGEELELSYICPNCCSIKVSKEGDQYVCEKCQHSADHHRYWIAECPECGSGEIKREGILIECKECGYGSDNSDEWRVFENEESSEGTIRKTFARILNLI